MLLLLLLCHFLLLRLIVLTQHVFYLSQNIARVFTYPDVPVRQLSGRLFYYLLVWLGDVPIFLRKILGLISRLICDITDRLDEGRKLIFLVFGVELHLQDREHSLGQVLIGINLIVQLVVHENYSILHYRVACVILLLHQNPVLRVVDVLFRRHLRLPKFVNFTGGEEVDRYALLQSSSDSDRLTARLLVVLVQNVVVLDEAVDVLDIGRNDRLHLPV